MGSQGDLGATDFDGGEWFYGPDGLPVLPGGFGRSTFSYVGAHAPFVARGAGPRLWDERGHELIDLHNNFTSLIHGNAHPEITRAAEQTIRQGTSFGMRHRAELRHATALLARIPGAEQVRYANSGTEAVMLAIRVARAHTGRERIVFVRSAYHGTSDPALVAGGKRATRGVPQTVIDEVIMTPLNDAAALTAAVEAAPGAVAAVVLDLLPNRAGLVPITAAFAAEVEALCRRQGILLIADEVVTFRLGVGGLAPELGLRPDMVALGKVIGGGFPVGAVAGRAKVMAELDPLQPWGLEHGGTFSGNPVTMAAGLAALELYDAAAVERLNDLGNRAREELARSVAGHDWEVRGDGSLLRLFPLGVEAPDDVAKLQAALWWAAYERGVLLTQNALAALSTVVDDAIVDDVLQRLTAAVAAVAGRRSSAELA